MADSVSVVPLRKVLLQAPEVIKEYTKIMIEEDIPVVCVNRSAGKKRSMPFKAMYKNNNRFWLQYGSWDFFLLMEDFTKIREKSVHKPGVWELGIIKTNTDKANNVTINQEKHDEKAETSIFAPVQGYGKEYEGITAMTDAQKIQKINEDKKRLDSLVAKKHAEPEAVTEAPAEALAKATAEEVAEVVETPVETVEKAPAKRAPRTRKAAEQKAEATKEPTKEEAEAPAEEPAEKPVKKTTRKTTKKAEEVPVEETAETPTEEPADKPVKKTTRTRKKAETAE